MKRKEACKETDDRHEHHNKEFNASGVGDCNLYYLFIFWPMQFTQKKNGTLLFDKFW